MSGSGCMITVKDNKVLLLKRNAYTSSPLTWCVPGGMIDPGENSYEAAIRETKEEANIDLSTFSYSKVITFPLIKGHSGTFTVYIFDFSQSLSEDYFSVKIDHESLDWGWFTPEEMKKLDLHPGMYYMQKNFRVERK